MRNADAKPTLTGKVPFVDFPLTYLDVGTDPVATLIPLPTGLNGAGGRLRMDYLALGVCMLLGLVVNLNLGDI